VELSNAKFYLKQSEVIPKHFSFRSSLHLT